MKKQGPVMLQDHPLRPAAASGELALPPGVSHRSSLQRVTVLDTAAASTNLGDNIIMEAVSGELTKVFPAAALFAVTSHEVMGPQSHMLIRQSDWTIAGGTSLISSRMWFRCSWRVRPRDALANLNVVLMGVGWYQYQGSPDPYSRWLLRSVLHRKAMHSVRDNYALEKLRSIGITNVVNTGCPTLWPLTPDHCASLPRTKAQSVLTTINSYPKLYDRDADARMIAMLRRHYRDVYLWIQTHSDFEYARSLDPDLLFVDPSLAALDAILCSDLDLDYVGNRLHAGIRALQKGRRAIIVEIDNRAREMGQDFGLPTVGRDEFERLEQMIEDALEIAVRLPVKEIELWKAQFREAQP
jgi:polysaccharide pyruvyl transferase WcaK-like protein